MVFNVHENFGDSRKREGENATENHPRYQKTQFPWFYDSLKFQ